jgi:thymidylate synthase, flavin-dependent|uniref:Thymidylate synthase complementing protein n=1 Tax=Podoviridae sp. ctZkC8 TaxID=2825259 RepID=A0A8S5UBD4_9CAUD|nr:MAG TPA: Thymidylate synthase complementing protein [Podoviridae sp. ctZkC8]
MKLIENKIEKLEQKHDLLGVYEQIEMAGRTAYKSLDKIEYDENGRSKTAKAFVDKMIKLGHGSPLEHGTVYLMLPARSSNVEDYDNNQYSTCKLCPYMDDYGNPSFAVTTNYRVLVENDLLDDLEFLCEPTEYHEKRTTFRLTCARVQADSFVRHRVFSFLMESTRYCNYNDGKFDGKITVVEPVGWDDFSAVQQNLFFGAWNYSEDNYMTLIKTGVKPEDARDVLPLQLKTELIMTGTESQWEQFFKLRISDHAHPDAKYIAEQIKEQL